MPVDLADLAAPVHTAVLTMELQQGVVGPDGSFPELGRAVRQGGVATATGRLLAAGRSAGVAIVHCTAGFRPDRRGSATNAPLLAAVARLPGHLVDGTPGVDLVPELDPAPTDLWSHRHHGVSPFGGTDLDATLRALGVTTVVATGVSLNVAIVGLAIGAVDLGYHVVVPRDAVTGVPADYAEAMLRHTIGLLATLTTVDELVGTWGLPADPGRRGDPGPAG